MPCPNPSGRIHPEPAPEPAESASGSKITRDHARSRLMFVGITEPSELEAIDASELEFLVKLAVIPHIHTTST